MVEPKNEEYEPRQTTYSNGVTQVLKFLIPVMHIVLVQLRKIMVAQRLNTLSFSPTTERSYGILGRDLLNMRDISRICQ